MFEGKGGWSFVVDFNGLDSYFGLFCILRFIFPPVEKNFLFSVVYLIVLKCSKYFSLVGIFGFWGVVYWILDK